MQKYSRQMILPEIGQEGQKRLSVSRILCVGAGGLGSPALMYLVAAGMGTIGIIDDDAVEVTNLHRQILFGEQEVGQSKAETAAERLRQMNADIIINIHKERLTAQNALAVMDGYDVVIDGSDNFSTKYLINDVCVKLGKPFVYGSALGFEARVSTFIPGESPCYRCLYPDAPKMPVANCAEAGVLGPVVGMAGSLQALEALKLALGSNIRREHCLDVLKGRLWMMDARSCETRIMTFDQKADCAVCSVPVEEIILKDEEKSCAVSGIIISATQAAEESNALFVDVREPYEWQAGHIKGAINLPLSVLNDPAQKTPSLDLSAKTIVYCQRGMRSEQAQKILVERGFPVMQMAGGIESWKGEIIRN
jgi:molybdopterin/thiamine biosynthesis adenylyltransferase/rhodanese-related sulfurtransferase